jgi:cyanophycin synthetase
VLETARGGMFKRGLAFDYCDVGVVLNIHDDHLGQHGAETLEDLARVKSLVAKYAKKAVVLNAEDPLVVEMAEEKQDSAEVIYFALDPANPVLEKHLDGGGRAVYLRRNMIMLAHGDHRLPLIEVERIPFTLKGRARFNVQNSLAAVAALVAMGYPHAQIVAGLSTFTSSVEQNPGRMNLFRVRDFLVMLDYAHNAESYKHVIETSRQLNHKRLIGVITAPGDRYDEKLKEIGRICGKGFDELIVRQMTDLRGRPLGEAPELIMAGVKESGFPMEKAQLILDEPEAIAKAIEMGKEGDLIVIGCSDTADMIRDVMRHAEILIPTAE